MSAVATDCRLDQVIGELKTVFRNKGMEPPPLSVDTVLDGTLGLESLDFAELVMHWKTRSVRTRLPMGRFLRCERSATFARYIERKYSASPMTDSNAFPAHSGARDHLSRFMELIDRSPQPAFVTSTGTESWLTWLERVEGMVGDFQSLSGARIATCLRSTPESYASFLALVILDCDVYLLDDTTTPDVFRELAEFHAFDVMLDACLDADRVPSGRWVSVSPSTRAGRGDVTIFTSGSTGRPKPVRHNWGSLTRPVRVRKAGPQLCWLLTYRPHLYAGLQVFLHCLLNQETLALPAAGMSVNDLLAFMCRHRVTSVSATPSYWRRLVALGKHDSLRALRLEQITLGGEVADQTLLTALRGLYPGARLVHIYATSELGRCFSVADGLAGFPASFLDRPTEDGVALRVENGELHVRSANAVPGVGGAARLSGGSTEWLATSDLVERSGDRYLFLGRRGDIINVGGNKVHPLRVEHVIQAVPGVRDARVFAQSSSLVGQMVACEFAAEPGFDPDCVEQAIRRQCLDRLSAFERPRLVRSAESIALSSADKKIRGPAQ